MRRDICMGGRSLKTLRREGKSSMLKMESCKGGTELTQGDKYETKEASSLRPTPSTKKDSKETLYDQKTSIVPEIG